MTMFKGTQGNPDAIWRGNEPVGMTMVDERPFNSNTERDAGVPFYWFGGGSGTVISDATAPHSPPNVLRGTYTTGDAGGSAAFGAGVEGQGISYKTLYVCWWAKYSSNWWGHLSNVNKHMYFGANGSVGQVYFECYGAGAGSLQPAMVVQAGLPSDDVYFPTGGAVVPRGSWFYNEVVLVGNTAGNADATLDWYLGGAHVGAASGAVIAAAAAKWDRIVLDPVWGGVGQTVPATMTLDIDAMYISGKN